MISLAERLTNSSGRDNSYMDTQGNKPQARAKFASSIKEHSASTLSARIFNIQRYSLNDGSGIRTVVFFKGCPHHCPWCANPESISRKIQVIRRKTKCIECHTCSHSVTECPSGALEKIGYNIDLPTLINILLKDEVFFRSSGGGVTLSGGEVLLQSEFAHQLLCCLQSLGIHTAIETAGDSQYENFLSVARYCDEVLFDFKIMDNDLAKKVCHIHLPRVLDNFCRLYHDDVTLIPRLPLIPSFTLDIDNVAKIIGFLKPFSKIDQIHILPFHQFGQVKYDLIHQQYSMKNSDVPSESQIEQIITFIKSYGYSVIQGG